MDWIYRINHRILRNLQSKRTNISNLCFSQNKDKNASVFFLQRHCFDRKITLRYIACVAWRFWLGALSNKGGRGQKNREEIEAEATWGGSNFFSRLRARISRLRRSCARLDKTAMLRRLYAIHRSYIHKNCANRTLCAANRIWLQTLRCVCLINKQGRGVGFRRCTHENKFVLSAEGAYN